MRSSPRVHTVFCDTPTTPLLALWLGAGLGSLNGWLVMLFPLFVIGLSMEARLEERLLESKFGETYRVYAYGKPRFIPQLGVRAL